MIPFDRDEHNMLAMRAGSPLCSSMNAACCLLRSRPDGASTSSTVDVPIRCELDHDLDADGRLWMHVWVDGNERWFRVDARVVGIHDVAGELFIVPPKDNEA